jgi:phosphoribosylaminoimidazole carboxylase PurE protein
LSKLTRIIRAKKKEVLLNPKVAVVMGSDSDLPVMEKAAQALDSFGIAADIIISSAHRSPAQTRRLAQSAQEDGYDCFIVGAGGAAHLAGVIAAETILPVIAVPIASSTLLGLDSLLATVQMPSGVPVATMAIGNAGAKNAAIMAAQILSLRYDNLREKLKEHKKNLEEEVIKKNARLNTP